MEINWWPNKFLVVLLGSLIALSAVHAAEPFYWRDSYGRGAGGGMTAHCSGDNDGGLCYPSCDDGYKGIGPVCWKERGIGAYGRGAGKVPAYNCGGKEQDAGLCYEQCSSGYKGAGPVCWGMGPPGYVECGAGYAINADACAWITAGQVTAVAMLLGAAIPGEQEAAIAAKQAEMGAGGVEVASKLTKLMGPMLAKMRPILDDIATKGAPVARQMAKLKAGLLEKLSSDPEEAEQIFQAAKYLSKYVKGATGTTVQALNGPEGAIDYLRLITTITGIMDPSPVSGMISSYAYPVYIPSASAPPAQPEPVVASRDYLYAVANGDLYYYQLQAGGDWGLQKKIGVGWGGMRVVTAGDRGELYALDNQGNLYFYKHNPQGQWQVSGEKIGFGFGGMKTIFAGGNFLDGVERRVLFALGNDGTLWYYKFGEAPNGAIETPMGVQIGWGWADCSKTFAGNGGVVYCIKSDGDLLRYPYDLRNPGDRTPGGVRVGVGWGAFTRVFAGADNQIYAVQANGDLLAYRDIGGRVIGPQKIGIGWSLPQVTAMKNW